MRPLSTGLRIGPPLPQFDQNGPNKLTPTGDLPLQKCEYSGTDAGFSVVTFNLWAELS
jgi:hypothetical protein